MNDVAERNLAARGRAVLDGLLARRLDPASLEWALAAQAEIAAGVSPDRFAALISLASRHGRGGPLECGEAERAAAAALLEGWDPAYWTRLEALRAALVLARGDLAEDSGARAIEDAFRYADVGEACALYRSLCLLPRGERFLSRAREGLRSNMTALFVAIACDQPYPFLHLDELGWNQMVIKALFVGAPLWRVFGLDRRLGPELARMALDLVDERRSAGRAVPHELWLCLGEHGGARALVALEREFSAENPNALGRRAAAYGLARAGATEGLAARLAAERDPQVATSLREALAGHTTQRAFGSLAAPS